MKFSVVVSRRKTGAQPRAVGKMRGARSKWRKPVREKPHPADSGHDDRPGGHAQGRERAQAPWMPRPPPT